MIKGCSQSNKALRLCAFARKNPPRAALQSAFAPARNEAVRGTYPAFTTCLRAPCPCCVSLFPLCGKGLLPLLPPC